MEDRRITERRERERRTMALRGPGAGGFTPDSSVSASNPCLNCGTNVQLVYCPECGQRETDTDPTLREMLRDAADHLLGWDGKLFRTTRLLVSQPGVLTQEYIAGRRVRYLTPVRTYLTASLVYFFCLAIAPSLSPVSVSANTSRAGAVVADRQAEAARPALARRIQRGQRAAQRQPDALPRELSKRLPTLLFVLVPAFALAVAIVYRDSRRRYPSHLAFGLHAHAFLFLASAAAVLTGFTHSGVVTTASVLTAVIASLWWMYAGARRVYHSRPLSTIWRLGMVGALYGVALALGSSALIVGSFYYLGAP